jgi:hypothetical protein
MTTTQQDLFVSTAVQSWTLTIKRATATFDNFSDEQLFSEVAPGRNRVLYLLGHLTAVHDRMLPLLGLGDRQYPHLDELFITSPDKAFAVLPPVQELRDAWKSINGLLADRFAALRPEEWLQKHTAISDEDFAKEPHRNRLSVLLGRTGHISFHLGQMVFLKK